MSTRCYPRFVKGNPQLRIFLPDWKMIMIKSHLSESYPKNEVLFKVDPRMTNWDVKNYLEKIYKVTVGGISSKIHPGELFPIRDKNYLCGKKDDYKIVRVTLPIGQTYEWPDLFPKKKKDEEETDRKRVMDELMKERKVDPVLKDVPKWFL